MKRRYPHEDSSEEKSGLTTTYLGNSVSRVRIGFLYREVFGIPLSAKKIDGNVGTRNRQLNRLLISDGELKEKNNKS